LDLSYDDMEDSWYSGIPHSFGWKRKFLRYFRETFSFFGFLSCWVGLWDFIDVRTLPDSFGRDFLYLAIPMFFTFFFEFVLSTESLYYIAAKQKSMEEFTESSQLLVLHNINNDSNGNSNNNGNGNNNNSNNDVILE